jgi:hypothetical protein
MMCNINMLHSSEHGYVAVCNNCGYVQLVFKIAALNLSEQAFKELHLIMENDLHTFRNMVNNDEKLLMYNTGDAKFNLVLSFTELEQITSLLSPAVLLLNANRILQESN